MLNPKIHRDLVEMMNNHNLGDYLDGEEPPGLVDDGDELAFTGKLANLGGKLPSETVALKSPEKKSRTVLGKTFRKDTKVIIW